MGIAIRKAKILALGMGISQAETNKSGLESAMEEEGNCLEVEAYVLDEESGEGT